MSFRVSHTFLCPTYRSVSHVPLRVPCIVPCLTCRSVSHVSFRVSRAVPCPMYHSVSHVPFRVPRCFIPCRSWTEPDRRVACSQLGFSGGEYADWYPWLNGTRRLLYPRPDCAGTERRLQDCHWQHRAMGAGVCGTACGTLCLPSCIPRRIIKHVLEMKEKKITTW